MTGARWVPLAEVTKPHGVRGEVRLKVYNADSTLLWSQRSVLCRYPDGREATLQLASIREGGPGGPIARFAGFEGRDAVEALRRASLSVRRDQFPELDEGEFYICDLAGAKVMRGELEVGEVLDVANYPSADSLVIRPAKLPSDRVEVPLFEQFVERVDVAGHVVLVREDAMQFFDG